MTAKASFGTDERGSGRGPADSTTIDDGALLAGLGAGYEWAFEAIVRLHMGFFLFLGLARVFPRQQRCPWCTSETAVRRPRAGDQ